jgi:hypothetical protein
MRKPETDTEQSSQDEVQAGDGTVNRQKSARFAEECLWISAGTFRVRRKGTWQTAGAVEWRSERTGRLTGVARYSIINGCSGAEPQRKLPANSAGPPVLVLAMADFTQSIFFRSSPVTFGHRFYFVCECGRNCGKLFLPSGEKQFPCRRCHKLRYDSQRHECDWFYRPLAASSQIPKRILKGFFHGIGNAVLREMLMAPEENV